MADYGLALDMMLTAMERRVASLADLRDLADDVLERMAFQHRVTAGFQQRECVRCGHGFSSLAKALRKSVHSNRQGAGVERPATNSPSGSSTSRRRLRCIE